MNRYKLPWHKRHQNAVRDALKTCGWIILGALVLVGWWYGMQWMALVQFADARVSKAVAEKIIAERAKDDAFAILKGDRPVRTEDGSEVVADVIWKKTKLVEGL